LHGKEIYEDFGNQGERVLVLPLRNFGNQEKKHLEFQRFNALDQFDQLLLDFGLVYPLYNLFLVQFVNYVDEVEILSLETSSQKWGLNLPAGIQNRNRNILGEFVLIELN
jgi:hypothetical protein